MGGRKKLLIWQTYSIVKASDKLSTEVDTRYDAWRHTPRRQNSPECCRMNFLQIVCDERFKAEPPAEQERIRYYADNRLVDLPDDLLEAHEHGRLTQAQFDAAVRNYRRQRCGLGFPP